MEGRKNGNVGQTKAVSLVRSGEDDKCLDTWLWARGIFLDRIQRQTLALLASNTVLTFISCSAFSAAWA